MWVCSIANVYSCIIPLPSGNTPKSTVQGAISTALSNSHQLKTFEPIEKKRARGTTYYRMTPRVLDASLLPTIVDSDATESDSFATEARKSMRSLTQKMETGIFTDIQGKSYIILTLSWTALISFL